VAPDFTTTYVSYGTAVDWIYLCQLPLGEIGAPDGPHILLCQSAVGVGLAPRRTSPLTHVPHVVLMTARIQMRRINARWVVAMMVNENISR
jgi:hypothetical protein